MANKVTAEQQYQSIKEQYPDCIIFFRMGDFYELFDDDAKEMSRVLGLTLTSRSKGEVKRPMAGIPHHALNNYLGKIVKLGYKIAVAEQMEDPKTAKGVIHREVSKIISAGSLIDDKNLKSEESNYILAINVTEDRRAKKLNFGLSWLELSTGEFRLLEITEPENNVYHDKLPVKIVNIIKRLSPREILLPSFLKYKLAPVFQTSYRLVEDFQFDFELNKSVLESHFKTSSLKGFGVEQCKLGVGAAGVILNYITGIQKYNVDHIHKIQLFEESKYMLLDASTIKNLELVWSLNNDIENSLLAQIDRTLTPGGKRLLYTWILHPLVDIDLIVERQNLVKFFTANQDIWNNLREHLLEIFDIERLSARIGLDTISPKDFVALSRSLISIIDIINLTYNLSELPVILQDIAKFKLVSEELSTLINNSILENPSYEVSDGGIFQDSYNSDLAELRQIKFSSNTWLENYQNKLVAETNISNLKVKFNNVFGYFIEISNSHLGKVPDTFTRKQTMVGGERFITPELKDMEIKILSADEKIIALERDLFVSFRAQFKDSIDILQQIAHKISQLDICFGFAMLAADKNYICPEILPFAAHSGESPILDIRKGRHPVVENILIKDNKTFIPNDISLNEITNNIILTGPNMSGKSTYIRMIAVIILLAQIGCFVPADICRFSLVDKIFTRIGASDNLASSESTFMVEMNETANILNNATGNSLIILDEVGRGTSTYDGVAIAWSIIKYIQEHLHSRTLFATHYHEITKLADKYTTITNSAVEVIEKDSQIIFTHRIVPGFAERSFGVHVAKLAGMPEQVLSDATNILRQFEDSKNSVQKVIVRDVEKSSKGKKENAQEEDFSGIVPRLI